MIPALAEAAESEAHATQALALARSIDHVGLQSMALDALSAATMHRNDWAGSREIARSRLTLGDRLDLTERMDSYSVAAWDSVMLGDLDDAVHVSREGLSLVQPGQVPAWALHLVAWRTYALALRGDWDEALVTGERARQLWIEAGEIPAGYANRGFFAALLVAFGRRDEPAAERFRGTADRILEQFTNARLAPIYRDVLRLKPEAAALLVTLATAPDARSPEMFERVVSLAVDREWPLPLEALEAARALPASGGMRHLRATLDRAIALTRSDAALFRAVLADAEAMRARPLIGRVHCELARVTGDDGETATGLEILRAIGDELQVARFER